MKIQHTGILHYTIILTILIMLPGCDQGKKPPTVNIDPEGRWLEEMTIIMLQQGYKEGRYTVRDVVSAYLGRIDEIDRKGPGLNSVIAINPDAIQIAGELDAEMKQGKIRGPMHGVPVLLKDNIDTHDKMPTTAGATALAGSIAPADSRVARKLREAGAVIIGKANLSEWANFRASPSSSGWSGVGGQPGIATSTGMTFAMRPHEA